MQDEKLLIMDPSDRKFISQNLRVILDNLMEPITSKALSKVIPLNYTHLRICLIYLCNDAKNSYLLLKL